MMFAYLAGTIAEVGISCTWLEVKNDGNKEKHTDYGPLEHFLYFGFTTNSRFVFISLNHLYFYTNTDISWICFIH